VRLAKDVGNDRAVGDVEPWIPELGANVHRQLPDFPQVLDVIPETR
jgi:hypothetical protein